MLDWTSIDAALAELYMDLDHWQCFLGEIYILLAPTKFDNEPRTGLASGLLPVGAAGAATLESELPLRARKTTPGDAKLVCQWRDKIPLTRRTNLVCTVTNLSAVVISALSQFFLFLSSPPLTCLSIFDLNDVQAMAFLFWVSVPFPETMIWKTMTDVLEEMKSEHNMDMEPRVSE